MAVSGLSRVQLIPRTATAVSLQIDGNRRSFATLADPYLPQPATRSRKAARFCRATLWAQPSGAHVNPTKLIGLILIVGGALAFAFGGFSYTKDSGAVKIGPVELSVKEKETVNVPLWAGIGAIVAGGLLIAFGKK